MPWTSPPGRPPARPASPAPSAAGSWNSRLSKIDCRFEWSTHCHGCALRAQCLGPGQKHRTIVVGQHHELLQARRLEQQTPAFKERTHRRNAIEGTHSELRRAHGLGRARYRGLAKVRLQNYFIGAACNVKRWISRLQWEGRLTGKGAPVALESG